MLELSRPRPFISDVSTCDDKMLNCTALPFDDLVPLGSFEMIGYYRSYSLMYSFDSSMYCYFM